jgi:hypothetical protein
MVSTGGRAAVNSRDQLVGVKSCRRGGAAPRGDERRAVNAPWRRP